jgi:anti-sigma B factor antagonist
MDDARFTRREVTLVTVTGTVDIFTAPRLREVLLAHIESGHVHLVVDLEKATFADSAAAAVLIGFWWRVRARRGHLVLAGAPEPIREIFHVGCLTSGIACYGTAEEALAEHHPDRVGAAS